MLESNKTSYGNEWRTYQEQNYNLEKHKVQAYSLLLGQCTQLLQDKMKQDTVCNSTIISYNPLILLQFIHKMVLAQTEYQYPFATVYNQKLAFYTFLQRSMTNPQWYDCFNTKDDVS